jgi:leucyl-tRNA synthetase
VQGEKEAELYRPQEIEPRWQRRWAETAIDRAPPPDGSNVESSTFYCLEFFPYPSGAGLSVGHGRNYVPTDVISRYRRMQGDHVLHPMGWDAFGLPAENEAVKRNIHPRETTTRYAANYRRQMTLMGCSYDWEREINSSTPDFYRWTQWGFLQLYQRNLAYRAIGRQWWCPSCQTVLANEQVHADGTCWRDHPGVYKRDMEQWYLRITAYADELLDNLETLDWPEHIVAMQRNWIGRSHGIEFEMAVDAPGAPRFTVFTTRPDTIYGMTFAVLAPEHPLLSGTNSTASIVSSERHAEVEAYCEAANRRSEVERVQAGRDGVFTGAYAINPVNSARVPIYVADYVLMSYGSGAIMAVPAHDQRDYDFAVRHGIPLPVVIAPSNWNGQPLSQAYTGEGTMVQSGPWDDLPSSVAAERIADWMQAQGIGRKSTQYRMRDWLISRQRYWGAPIPIVYCDVCGVVPVPKEQLPVLLPHIDAWLPGQDGRSPLANVPDFVHTTCPICDRPARRETDTLDGFACSSWYFLRFVSPRYDQGPFDPPALSRWGTPDLYVGGTEHAVMHLLYARFWTKALADAGIVPFREPFPVLRCQGVMHARDPESGQVRRMSKSTGNVVTPDEVAETHGADALRVYLMFMAPFENNTVWEEAGITGAWRFLDRTWRLVSQVAQSTANGSAGGEQIHSHSITATLHRTIRRVTKDIEVFKFNTAIAALMECLNALVTHQQVEGTSRTLQEAVRQYVLLLAPFAPHIAEELWAKLGEPYSVHQQPWPAWDQALVHTETITLIVQVDGRVRARLEAPAEINEPEARAQALDCPGVQRSLNGRGIARVIYVPSKLINIVTKP